MSSVKDKWELKYIQVKGMLDEIEAQTWEKRKVQISSK